MSLVDLVVLAHFAFIAFAVFGGLLWLRWRWTPWVHLPAVVWGVWVELAGRICPLTPLENSLRRAAGDADYGGGFVEHYLVPVIYPTALTREMQLLLAAGLVLVNAAIYVLVWRRRRER